MKRLLGILSPLALVLAVGCGGGGGSLDDLLGSEREPAPETPRDSDTGDDATDSSADGAADPAPSGGDDDGSSAAPPQLSGDVEAYCRIARGFDEINDDIDEALGSFTFEPEQIREAFLESQRALAELGRMAPAEIRDDLAVTNEAFGRLLVELEQVDFNFFALDFEALEVAFADAEDATARIEEYHERVCGIPAGGVDDFDDAFGDLGDLGDLDEMLEGLGDMFGEMGDLFGDNGGMGEFGGFFVELLVEEFVSEGYTEAEARCLAEASLDFEALFDSFSDGDFDNFVDPFERCGVTPRN